MGGKFTVFVAIPARLTLELALSTQTWSKIGDPILHIEASPPPLWVSLTGSEADDGDSS